MAPTMGIIRGVIMGIIRGVIMGIIMGLVRGRNPARSRSRTSLKKPKIALAAALRASCVVMSHHSGPVCRDGG